MNEPIRMILLSWISILIFFEAPVSATPKPAYSKPCLKKDFEADAWVDPQSKEFLDRFKSPTSPRVKKSGLSRIELWSLIDVAESPDFNPASCLGNIESSVEQYAGPTLAIEKLHGAPILKGLTVKNTTTFGFKFLLKNAAGSKELKAELIVRP